MITGSAKSLTVLDAVSDAVNSHLRQCNISVSSTVSASNFNCSYQQCHHFCFKGRHPPDELGSASSSLSVHPPLSLEKQVASFHVTLLVDQQADALPVSQPVVSQGNPKRNPAKENHPMA